MCIFTQYSMHHINVVYVKLVNTPFLPYQLYVSVTQTQIVQQIMTSNVHYAYGCNEQYSSG
jgi:hypothetical protein